MTKDQVKSYKQFGPYKSFKNGDLETYNGIYRGHKENVQFFFENDRLVRIGVYLYEGEDKQKAAAMFTRVYRLLEKDYGRILIPEIHVAKGSEPVNAEILGIAAMVILLRWVERKWHLQSNRGMSASLPVSCILLLNRVTLRSRFSLIRASLVDQFLREVVMATPARIMPK
jgi:hypothetical protein